MRRQIAVYRVRKLAWENLTEFRDLYALRRALIYHWHGREVLIFPLPKINLAGPNSVRKKHLKKSAAIAQTETSLINKDPSFETALHFVGYFT